MLFVMFIIDKYIYVMFIIKYHQLDFPTMSNIINRLLNFLNMLTGI